MRRLKRLNRYLISTPRAVYTYPWQAAPTAIDGYVDSDWAGCKGTRRSTSGGFLQWGQHVLKTSEAERYSFVNGAAQMLGMLAIARDLGLKLKATIHTDGSAALGIVQRQGLGKLRHIGTQYLWIQEKVRSDELNVAKILVKVNPADMLTKNVPGDAILRHTKFLGIQLGSGRVSSAPQLSVFGTSRRSRRRKK